MIGVKICGLTEEAGITAAVTAKADWLGFVFHQNSPRYVSIEHASHLCGFIPPSGPKRVALFVRPETAWLHNVLENCQFDAIQLYDTTSRITDIRQFYTGEIWHAHGVADLQDLPAHTPANRLVIEARAPTDATRPGGNGQSFDWDITKSWNAPVPWLLAGGLNPENILQALNESKAHAVDVSSGVESSPGIKCPSLVNRFITRAKAHPALK